MIILIALRLSTSVESRAGGLSGIAVFDQFVDLAENAIDSEGDVG